MPEPDRKRKRRRRRHGIGASRSPLAIIASGRMVYWFWAGVAAGLVALAYFLSSETPDDPDAGPERVLKFKEVLVWPLITLAAVLVVALVSRFLWRRLALRRVAAGQPARAMPYRRKPVLLSAAERIFHSALLEAVGEDAIVFAKVRLGDLLDVPLDTSQWRKWHAQITDRHIDFVLCTVPEVSPVLLIELDDRTRRRSDHATRKAFLDAVMKQAGWPLEHVAAAPAYDVAELAARVRGHLAATELAEVASAEVAKGTGT